MLPQLAYQLSPLVLVSSCHRLAAGKRVYISRSIMLLILAAYVFAPTAFGWMIDPGGAWFRPYIIWAGIVLATFCCSRAHPITKTGCNADALDFQH